MRGEASAVAGRDKLQRYLLGGRTTALPCQAWRSVRA